LPYRAQLGLDQLKPVSEMVLFPVFAVTSKKKQYLKNSNNAYSLYSLSLLKRMHLFPVFAVTFKKNRGIVSSEQKPIRSTLDGHKTKPYLKNTNHAYSLYSLSLLKKIHVFPVFPVTLKKNWGMVARPTPDVNDSNDGLYHEMVQLGNVTSLSKRKQMSILK
jgi:hypothetical protein